MNSRVVIESVERLPAEPVRLAAAPARSGRLRGAIRAAVSEPGLALSIAVIAVVLVAAAYPEFFTSLSPIRGVAGARLAPPGVDHLFGTDHMGRDLFARVVYGTRESLKAVALAVTVGLVIGSAIGLFAGCIGRWVDDILMRLMDVLLAVPMLLISMAIISALGFGMVNIAIAVGIGSLAGFARVMRAEVLKVRATAYVEAAIFSGIGPLQIFIRHVLPNSFGPVLVLATLELGWAILNVSALSFLGFGPPPPTPEWGLLIAGGRDFLAVAWWLTVMPGVVVMVTVLAANRVARALDGQPTATF
jgi:peptide/nickel transport system permease protein